MSLQTTQDSRQPLTLAEAQQIASSVIGGVHWHGEEGYCPCPGAHRHTAATTTTDCKAVCAPLDKGGSTLAPGVYCFHDSCRAEVDAASFELRSALGKRTAQLGAPVRAVYLPARRPDPVFDRTKLERLASRLPDAGPEWFAMRSPKRVDNRTPASFLHDLYRPGEQVVIFDVFTSQGQAVWSHTLPPFDAGELDDFTTGKPNGVWFLANPVSGEWAQNDRGQLSRRSWQTVTTWRYLVLESDKADPAQWLSALAQLPLPISAIYTSGGKSIHALLRLDAESKAEWDVVAARMKPALITLGADRKAISAVRLTRLPLCERLGTVSTAGEYVPFPEPQRQELIYLDPNPTGAPICERGAF